MTPGSQLAQSRPDTVGAVTVYSATLHTEITRLIICNTHSASAVFTIYHDNGGADYSRDNSLYFENSMPGNVTRELASSVDGGGISVSRNGTIGLRTSPTGSVALSVYGITQPAR